MKGELARLWTKARRKCVQLWDSIKPNAWHQIDVIEAEETKSDRFLGFAHHMKFCCRLYKMNNWYLHIFSLKLGRLFHFFPNVVTSFCPICIIFWKLATTTTTNLITLSCKCVFKTCLSVISFLRFATNFSAITTNG